MHHHVFQPAVLSSCDALAFKGNEKSYSHLTLKTNTKLASGRRGFVRLLIASRRPVSQLSGHQQDYYCPTLSPSSRGVSPASLAPPASLSTTHSDCPRDKCQRDEHNETGEQASKQGRGNMSFLGKEKAAFNRRRETQHVLTAVT